MQTPPELVATLERTITKCYELILDGQDLYNNAFGQFKDSLDGSETATKDFKDTYTGFNKCYVDIVDYEQAVQNIIDSHTYQELLYDVRNEDYDEPSSEDLDIPSILDFRAMFARQTRDRVDLLRTANEIEAGLRSTVEQATKQHRLVMTGLKKRTAEKFTDSPRNKARKIESSLEESGDECSLVPSDPNNLAQSC